MEPQNLLMDVLWTFASSTTARATPRNTEKAGIMKRRRICNEGSLSPSANHIVRKIEEDLLSGMKGKNLESFFGTLHIC